MLRMRERNRVEAAEHVDSRRVKARLLLCFPKGGADHAIIFWIDSPAWKGDLPRMRTQSGGAGQQQHVKVARNRTRLRVVVAGEGIEHPEQDQHGSLSRVIADGKQPVTKGLRRGCSVACQGHQLGSSTAEG